MILRYDQGMNTRTDTNVKIIENATRADVRSGDHLTWKWAQEIDGVTVKSSHEGIAHHQDEYGDWWTEGGMWLTSVGAGTLTIRRPVQELPTASCAVIVPADGCEFILVTDAGGWAFERMTYSAEHDRWYGMTKRGAIAMCIAEQIIPGTWKVEDQ